MREEIAVTTIEAVENSVVVKTTYPRKGFVVPVRYVCEDGRTIPSRYFAERKKDVVAYLATLPEQPKGMKALFQDGEFWGTQRSLSLWG